MKYLTTTGLIAGLLFSTQAQAQDILFSIDWHSPAMGAPDSLGGVAITNGDLLTAPGGVPALGPLVLPDMIIPHALGGLGIIPGCSAPAPGVMCRTEVDALSLGQDDRVQPAQVASGALQFSVDVFATGVGPAAPNVFSESPVGDASADVMRNIGFIPGLPAPPGFSIGHFGLYDGNGMASGTGFTSPGLGLREPSAPIAAPANPGDNVDAMDLPSVGTAFAGDVYFSLDSFFLDPLTGIPNAGSAITNGVSSADILKTTVGFAPVVYAPSLALGLDFLGPNQPDDVDALALWDNGDGIYQASQVPFDWMTGTTDMLLFSVRRGSPVIGMPDSIFGIPIEEGDVLTTPLPTIFGGVSPFPGIFVAAERIGLGTMRSGTASGNTGDDLDGLDYRLGIFNDCDGDGVDDNLAIATFLVADTNMNGIPDSCETTTFCTPLPNSTGFPTSLTSTFTGSPGTGLHLDASDGPPTQFGFFLIGTGLSPTGVASGAGILCLDTTGGNLISRYVVWGGALNSVGVFNAAGDFVNLVGTSTTGMGYDVPVGIPTPIGGTITGGSTWHFQLWHRDVGPTWNFSNPVSYTF